MDQIGSELDGHDWWAPSSGSLGPVGVGRSISSSNSTYDKTVEIEIDFGTQVEISFVMINGDSSLDGVGLLYLSY